MTTYVECPLCKGRGKIPLGVLAVIRCGMCSGSGIVSPKMREDFIEAQEEKDENHGPAA